ncbi:pyridoxamine 5'-phosphate oxidase family protein [Kineosporia sp. NBRC 101731]|uniref:pyridoxamine 5'-phosphate oxidase family protein n=1 Tax=Kineosporia sp. NBRC 101731 TaxID=3032199 RepID=UPI0024A3AFEF|nr:pyridoxamine 5'-phosphate oxidase family protein [Kineosporia sp. NBRC 101731]GLY30930.1 hypothetical protein Kisp02_42950 [Kineosporia sp. NBRC 101731]
MTSSPAPEHLSPSSCWEYLRSSDLGRLAVVVAGRPDIFPINYAVDHGCVLVRTADGTKLSAALGGDVAFEADGFAPGTGQAWSVVLRGRAEELVHLDELLAVDDLPLNPLHGAPKNRFLRIVPDEISGRRFVTIGSDIWKGPLTGSRRVPRE